MTDFEDWIGIELVGLRRELRQAMAKRRPGKRLHFGLIGQEVQAALDGAGVDAALHKVGPDGVHSLGYTELIAPLIAAVQELAEQNESLTARVSALENKR